MPNIKGKGKKWANGRWLGCWMHWVRTMVAWEATYRGPSILWFGCYRRRGLVQQHRTEQRRREQFGLDSSWKSCHRWRAADRHDDWGNIEQLQIGFWDWSREGSLCWDWRGFRISWYGWLVKICWLNEEMGKIMRLMSQNWQLSWVVVRVWIRLGVLGCIRGWKGGVKMKGIS
jgi:hypothetical protein